MEPATIVSLARVIEKWHRKEVVEGPLSPSPFVATGTFVTMATAALTVLDALEDYQNENPEPEG
jgi:hypothetical protein